MGESEYRNKDSDRDREDGISISAPTLLKAATGQHIQRRWGFDEFWRRAEYAVQFYAHEKCADVLQKWEEQKKDLEQICRMCFFDLNAPERISDFPPDYQALTRYFEASKTDMLNNLKTILKSLGEENADIIYRYYRCFPAVASITESDLGFLTGLFQMTEAEKAGLRDRMEKQETVDAVTMLDRMNSEELRTWLELRNNSFANTISHRNGIQESIDKFLKKCKNLSGWRLFVLHRFIFLALVGPGIEEHLGEKIEQGEKIELDPRRFSNDEIDLFLMFKYILTGAAQKDIMNFL